MKWFLQQLEKYGEGRAEDGYVCGMWIQQMKNG